jgi:hypothetical protein
MSNFNARDFVNDSLFSDMHKEVYGSRPGGSTYAHWYQMSEAELIAERDYLIAGCERACDEERQRSKLAAEHFEVVVAAVIASGAGDRATAIRWIAQSEGCEGDYEHLEWRMGIDFGYIAGAPRPLWTREEA